MEHLPHRYIDLVISFFAKPQEGGDTVMVVEKKAKLTGGGGGWIQRWFLRRGSTCIKKRNEMGRNILSLLLGLPGGWGAYVPLPLPYKDLPLQLA